MRCSRRDMLAAITSGLGLLTVPRWGWTQESEPLSLRATPNTVRLVPPPHPETKIWGFEGSIPGPLIKLRQGERFTRRFINQIPQPSSVHWHGIRLVNAMDGVPGLTQDVVVPQGDFLYDFTPPDAGTYWYHSHHRSWEQMARGLYGPLIIEEAEPPQTDRDQVLVLDDWRLDKKAQLTEDFESLHDWAHAGRIGNLITVNGDSEWMDKVARYERLRLRLINVANARVFSVRLQGLTGWMVALDGQPLRAIRPVPSVISLAPGQRVDLIVDVTAQQGAEALLLSSERGGDYVLASFAVEAKIRAAPLPLPASLPANPVSVVQDLAMARRIPLRMEGGAMGGLRNAMLNGIKTDMRDMAAQGKVWAFNGIAGMSEIPFFTATRGETIRINLINETSWPHAIHLHGHHFHKIMDSDSGFEKARSEGNDTLIGPLRDTILINRAESMEIAFVADNPGKWLLHCHMLGHQASGMKTWFEIV